jgi:hypothetical protein
VTSFRMIGTQAIVGASAPAPNPPPQKPFSNAVAGWILQRVWPVTPAPRQSAPGRSPSFRRCCFLHAMMRTLQFWLVLEALIMSRTGQLKHG